MPGISEASCALKIGLVLSPIALVLTIVGMATPYWLEDKVMHVFHSGLWVTCAQTPTLGVSVCTSYIDLAKLTEDAYPDWLKASEALVVLGTLAGVVATVTVFLCAFVDYVGRNKISHVMTMLANFAAGGFVLLGSIIYVAKFIDLAGAAHEADAAKLLSWSFALCIVGGAGYLVTGMILICDVRQRWYL